MAEVRGSNPLGSTSVSTADERFHHSTPNLIDGDDLRKAQAFGARLRGFESGYANSNMESKGEAERNLLWLFASTNKPWNTRRT